MKTTEPGTSNNARTLYLYESISGGSKSVNPEKIKRGGKLEHDIITVHNKPNSRSITFNQDIAKKAKGFQYMKYCLNKDGKRMYLIFGNIEESDSVPGVVKLCRYKDSGQALTCYGAKMVASICEFFNLGEGDYHIKVEDISGQYNTYNTIIELKEVRDKFIFQGLPVKPVPTEKKCTKCGRTLPLSMFYKNGKNRRRSICKSCYKDYHKGKNEGAIETNQENPLERFTDKQLFDELKQRGWEGKLTKNQTLE